MIRLILECALFTLHLLPGWLALFLLAWTAAGGLLALKLCHTAGRG